MTEEPESIVLHYRRHSDERLDRVDVGLTNLTTRLAPVAEQGAVLRRDFLRLEVRIDQMDDRIKRIERHLDVVEA